MTLLKPAVRDDRKFCNPVPTTVGGPSMALKVLPLYFSNPAETEPKRPLGPFRTDPGAYAIPPETGLRVTWFGHSSMLLEIDGVRVLIDPVWDERASPAQFFGPKRFFPPTIALEDLPAIDVVLISHDHYDHLGAGTIRSLAKLPNFQAAKWLTSLGVARRLRDFGVQAQSIQELDWTDSVIAGALKITSWPARHFSGRGIRDRFTTLWASFVLEGPVHRVYFGADSGPWDGFSEIASQYSGFDLIMLEIGAYHPLWGQIHLGPDGAAETFRTMRQHAIATDAAKPGLLMPIHWGLFNLALHAWRQPMESLERLADELPLPLWSPRPGKPTEVRGEHVDGWWRDTLSS